VATKGMKGSPGYGQKMPHLKVANPAAPAQTMDPKPMKKNPSLGNTPPDQIQRTRVIKG
jgi:hypothetical protein